MGGRELWGPWSRRSGEILSSGPIGTRACRRYLIQPSMLHGLLIREVKGAELDLIADACDNPPTCIDYPDAAIFHLAPRKYLAR